MKFFLLLLMATISTSAAVLDITKLSECHGKRLIINKNILIHSGDTMVVPLGMELLFSNFSGITVLSGGYLEAIGTKEQPIFFTSLQDTTGSASAFDWNGIELQKGASTNLAYCFIAFSTSGITAEDSVGIKLNNCIFTTNGQWNISISGIIKQIPDLKPFSYAPQEKLSQALPVVLENTIEEIPQLPATGKPSKLNSRFWILCGTGVVLISASAASLYKANQYTTEYNNMVPGNPWFDSATPNQRQTRFDDLRYKHRLSRTIGWSCMGLAYILYLSYTIKF